MPSKPTIPRVCMTCSEPFFAVASEINRGGGIFCGHSCSTAAQRKTVEQAFWPKVHKSASCWLWIGAHTRANYGKMGIRTIDGLRTVEAHRVAWKIATGEPVPDDFNVLHDCPGGDNPSCVRNDVPGWKEINGVTRPKFGHLWIGTASENTRDMLAKGRGGVWIHPECLTRGATHHNAKLTENDVRTIRSRYSRGGISQERLGQKYKVSQVTISGIILRRSWGHLT